MLNLPPLYPITDAASPVPLAEQIRRLGAAGFPLVQFRGKPLDAKVQWNQLRQALEDSRANGGWPQICVNDRVDLAVLAAEAGLTPWGLHLGQDDLPPLEARRLPGLQALHFGTSTHEEAEWSCVDPACDHAGLGPFRATATKGDHAPPIGIQGLRRGCALLRAGGLSPVAIGGLTLTDAGPCFAAGAESLAMIGEIVRADAPEDLLWEAQRLRWQAKPPFIRGQGIVLIGGSGCGKTSLAQALGAELRMPVRDLDGEIVARVGRSIPEIFAEQGEAQFRNLEASILPSLLETPAVVALGGGAWEDESTRSRVCQARFQALWVTEDPRVAWDRVRQDLDRPLAADWTSFMTRWHERTPRWWEAPMVLPLGRDPKMLAQAMAFAAGGKVGLR